MQGNPWSHGIAMGHKISKYNDPNLIKKRYDKISQGGFEGRPKGRLSNPRGYYLEEELEIGGKKVKRINKNNSNNPEDYTIEYEDGTSEPYVNTLEEIELIHRSKINDPLDRSIPKSKSEVPLLSGKRYNVLVWHVGSKTWEDEEGHMTIEVDNLEKAKEIAKDHYEDDTDYSWGVWDNELGEIVFTVGNTHRSINESVNEGKTEYIVTKDDWKKSKYPFEKLKNSEFKIIIAGEGDDRKYMFFWKEDGEGDWEAGNMKRQLRSALTAIAKRKLPINEAKSCSCGCGGCEEKTLRENIKSLIKENIKSMEYGPKLEKAKKKMEKLKKELRKIEKDLKAHRKAFKPGNPDKSYGDKIDNFRDIWSRKKSQIHKLDKEIDNYKQKLKT